MYSNKEYYCIDLELNKQLNVTNTGLPVPDNQCIAAQPTAPHCGQWRHKQLQPFLQAHTTTLIGLIFGFLIEIVLLDTSAAVAAFNIGDIRTSEN